MTFLALVLACAVACTGQEPAEQNPSELPVSIDRIKERLSRPVVLQLPAETISVASNFFALGGHSLLAQKALSRIQTKFQINLKLRILFELATLSELAKHIADMDDIRKLSIEEIEMMSEEEAERYLNKLNK